VMLQTRLRDGEFQV